MSNSITNVAKQFAEANTQEQQWLRDEIKELQAVIGSLVRQNGGTARIPKRDMLIQSRFTVTEHPYDKCYVLELI